MIRTSSLTRQEACLSAVCALDELVTELVRARSLDRLKIQASFFDWIADVATPLVERRVMRLFNNPRFAASLRRSDHRLALARWVRQWVSSRILARFEELAVYLLAFPQGPHGVRLLPAAGQAAPAPGQRRPSRAAIGLATPA